VKFIKFNLVVYAEQDDFMCLIPIVEVSIFFLVKFLIHRSSHANMRCIQFSVFSLLGRVNWTFSFTYVFDGDSGSPDSIADPIPKVLKFWLVQFFFKCFVLTNLTSLEATQLLSEHSFHEVCFFHCITNCYSAADLNQKTNASPVHG